MISSMLSRLSILVSAIGKARKAAKSSSVSGMAMALVWRRIIAAISGSMAVNGLSLVS